VRCRGVLVYSVRGALILLVRSANTGNDEEDNHVDLGGTEERGTTIDDFVLLKVVGKGSFGRVLLARLKTSDRLYAIKVLSKKAIKQRNEVQHIMAERNVLLRSVRHPFLVGLHFSFQTPEKLYFVLDYINGGELFFHLQREKRFPETRARFYAAEITSAIGYLHSLDIVYRDLKPENILLDSTGHVVLTDFGLCKEGVELGSTTHTFCGTPEYLAPEVLKKQGYGRPVDWWCLGAVVYEMLVGLPPFYSRDCNEMYYKILHERLRFPTHVSECARQLLTGLLDRDPALRLGSGPQDAEDIKRHVFFKDLDWAKLERREYEAPFNPGVASELDLRNFDPEFVREPIPGSLTGHDISIDVEMDDTFAGFTYTADDAVLAQSPPR
jgi:serum/glucocorticoid-regulated kinase 3